MHHRANVADFKYTHVYMRRGGNTPTRRLLALTRVGQVGKQFAVDTGGRAAKAQSTGAHDRRQNESGSSCQAQFCKGGVLSMDRGEMLHQTGPSKEGNWSTNRMTCGITTADVTGLE